MTSHFSAATGVTSTFSVLTPGSALRRSLSVAIPFACGTNPCTFTAWLCTEAASAEHGMCASNVATDASVGGSGADTAANDDATPDANAACGAGVCTRSVNAFDVAGAAAISGAEAVLGAPLELPGIRYQRTPRAATLSPASAAPPAIIMRCLVIR